MSRKKKNRRQPDSAVRADTALGNDDVRMSDVILKLAEPLLKKYGNTPKRFESIIALTIAAWNKALLPDEKQVAVEQELIDIIFPKDGRADEVGGILQAFDIIDERRKLLFPKLRKFVASYDIKFSDGRVSLNVGWAPIPAPCETNPSALPPEEKDAYQSH